MSGLISDMLCTKGINVYIDAFGGSGKCTLNVPPYPEQIYNDSSAGMCCLIGLLSNEETGMELIRRLYDTEFSEDCFNESMQFRNECEDNFLQELIRQLGKLLRSIDKEYDAKLNRSLNRQLKAVYLTENNNLISLDDEIKAMQLSQDTLNEIAYLVERLNVIVRNYYDGHKGELTEQEELDIKKEVDTWVKWYCKKNTISKEVLQEKKHLKQVGNTFKLLREQCLKRIFFESACNMRIETMDIETQYKLAISTFVVYQQSRDGAGVAWSKEKFHTTDDYHKRVDNLYECMKRLEGVKVQQIGALSFFIDQDMKLAEVLCEEQEKRKSAFTKEELLKRLEGHRLSYLNREDVMIYCDPTYLKDSTADDEDSDPLREYNPGMIYKHFWTRADHELFLQLIQNAKCKLLVSNYDDKDHLYDRYLSGGKWHRFDFETVTTMSNSENNQRTECLWYNYEI